MPGKLWDFFSLTVATLYRLTGRYSTSTPDISLALNPKPSNQCFIWECHFMNNTFGSQLEHQPFLASKWVNIFYWYRLTRAEGR